MTEFHITEKKRKREQIYLRSIHEDDLIKVIDQHGREVAFLREVSVRSAYNDVDTVSLTAIEADGEDSPRCGLNGNGGHNESKHRQQVDTVRSAFKAARKGLKGSDLLPRSPSQERGLAILKQWWRSAAHVLDKGKRIAWRKGNQRGLSRNIGSDRKV